VEKRVRDDEAALVSRLRAGEEDAYREFVDIYQDRVLTVVGRVAGAADAEDVAQETFIKAFGAIHRFEGQSALFTWLYRIAVNAARDHLAHRRRRPAVPLDERLVEPVAAGDGPDRALQRQDDRRRVRRALDKLPEPFRTTLVLREMEGHTYDEIASILEVSIGTVESRIFRARGKLRAILEKDQP
jgi:RNA polymerase sigma-70 factor (ECF subfamily)